MKKLLRVHGSNYHTSMLGSINGFSSVEKRYTVISQLGAVLRSALIELRHTDDDPIGLVGIGMSGMLLVPSLADIEGIPFMMVRQSNTTGAGGRAHEGRLFGIGADRLLFVDDLISSGKTLLFVASAIEHAGSRIVGVIVDQYMDRAKYAGERGDGPRVLDGRYPSAKGIVDVCHPAIESPLPYWL